MLDEIIKNLKSLSCKELREVSAQIGVSYDNLIKIRLGVIKDPKLSTALAIQNFFNK